MAPRKEGHHSKICLGQGIHPINSSSSSNHKSSSSHSNIGNHSNSSSRLLCLSTLPTGKCTWVWKHRHLTR